MKTITLTLAIFTSSLFNLTHANESINMNKILEQVITFKNGSLTLEKDKIEFVKISFKINEEGRIDILNFNYSNEKIKNKLIEQLRKMEVYGAIDINKIYNYNFTFKKI